MLNLDFSNHRRSHFLVVIRPRNAKITNGYIHTQYQYSLLCLLVHGSISQSTIQSLPDNLFPFLFTPSTVFQQTRKKTKNKNRPSLTLNHKTTIVAPSLNIDPIVLLVAKKKRVSNDETIAQAIEPKKR